MFLSSRFDSGPLQLFSVTNMSNPTQSQVGGDHYRTMAIQPERFIYENGIGFHEGSAIKYLCRWRSKGGLQDLEKAKHFIDLLIAHQPVETEPATLPLATSHHNPDNLESAGEGYRFCLVTEKEEPGFTEWWNGKKWSDGGQIGGEPLYCGATYRTNKPLPTE